MWSLSRRQVHTTPALATAAAATSATLAANSVVRSAASTASVTAARTATLTTVAAAARGSIYAARTGRRLVTFGASSAAANVAGLAAAAAAVRGYSVVAPGTVPSVRRPAVTTRATALRRKTASTRGLATEEAEFDQATDICRAAFLGSQADVEAILDQGFNVDNGDYDGRTAIHLAACEGHLDLIKWLVESKGADVNVKDRFNGTPLGDAIAANHVEVVEYLRSVGAETAVDQNIPPAPALEVWSEGDLGKLDQALVDQVYQHLIDESVFSPVVVQREVDYFFNKLKLQPYYFNRFSSKDIASHIMLYISAKRIAATSDDPDTLSLKIDQPEFAFYLTSDEFDSMLEVEHKIEEKIEEIEADDRCASVTHFLSQGTAVPFGSKRLGMYIVENTEFISANVDDQETDMELIASKVFLSTKKETTRQRYQDLVSTAVGRLRPTGEIDPVHHDGTIPVRVAFRDTTKDGEISIMTEVMESLNMSCERKVVESFSNGIQVHSLFFNAPQEAVANWLRQTLLLISIPRSAVILPSFTENKISAFELAYATAVSKFVFYWMSEENEDLSILQNEFAGNSEMLARLISIRQRMRTDVVTEDRIGLAVARHPELVKAMFADFEAINSPSKNSDGATGPAYNDDLEAKILKEVDNDLDQAIFKEFLTFNASVLKTNFYVSGKCNMTFRFAPDFVLRRGFPEAPYGLFMSMANDYTGFHVRFSDIARGGIRVVKSANDIAFQKNNETVFQENYGLAYTQNKKNKDIPEFGSKGTVLLARDAQSNGSYAFRKYISGLLDLLLLPNEEIIDHYGQEEILFFGPDENTADVMDWACEYAKQRGYSYWKAATTGKAPRLGGIPHDTYGMTTRSVHRNVLEMLAVNGVKEEDCTKFQTGGPDGDLGSNEILISKDRTIAIVDGSGVVFEPNGLHRPEMERLARERYMVHKFDQSALSSDGFFVGVDDHNITLPNGDVIDSGLAFRNEFHLNPLSSADLFVPCGGRPESVNQKNVHKMFHPDGTSRFRFIVEGANLFLTQEARIYMEKKGVPVIKDACANKGGVFSSSLEVLAALSLTDDEFSQHMAVEDENNIPAFYTAYVDEVQRRIEENAYLEFHCLEKESKRTGIPRTLLSDQISDKINDLNKSISESDLIDNEVIRTRILSKAIPQLLIDQVGSLEEVVSRLPEAYTRHLFCAFLASRYVYASGLDADEFSFFEYMSEMDKH